MMRAANKFSHLHWVFANNTSKKAMFSSQDKLNMMKIYVDHYKLTNVIIDSVEGSVARFASKVQADYLIRGLRSSSDYQMEYELSVGNRGIDKNLETICMFTKPHYATISSSIVRELAVLNEPITQYVHPKVEEMVATIVQSRR
jgi:pantetheine-phosphate adenylyltransferase